MTGRARLVEQRVDEQLQLPVDPEPARTHRKVHPGQARVESGAVKRHRVGGGGVVLGQHGRHQLPQLVPDRLGHRLFSFTAAIPVASIGSTAPPMFSKPGPTVLPRRYR